MREDVELFFKEHREREIGGDFVKKSPTVDGDHGRIETRRYWGCSDIGWLKFCHDWPGLEAVIMTEYTHEIKGEFTTIRRYYVSTFADSPEKMTQCNRNHWQVKNCLHWVLDVTFWQDDCRIRKANAAVNFATINHAVINLLKRSSDMKISLPQKRCSAALDDDYMEAIIRQKCSIDYPSWWGEYEAWRKRDLTGKRYVYMWADGVCFTPRLNGDRQCMLVVIGADEYGEKDVLAVMDGFRENADSWRDLLKGLERQGLTVPPELATGDGALGFWAALHDVFPETFEQRCSVHKTSNVLGTMPKSPLK